MNGRGGCDRYQKIERRKLTSSITTVDMDRLRMVNQPSIDKLLQGQVRV